MLHFRTDPMHWVGSKPGKVATYVFSHLLARPFSKNALKIQTNAKLLNKISRNSMKIQMIKHLCTRCATAHIYVTLAKLFISSPRQYGSEKMMSIFAEGECHYLNWGVVRQPL